MATHHTSQRTTQLGSGLVAILLVTRSRPGPRLVFHYPPSVDVHEIAPGNSQTSAFNSDSDEDDDPVVHHRSVPRINPGFAHLASGKGPTEPGGDHDSFLGHSVETLEKLLAPGRWADGKKFEISIDGLTFIGHPVYAPEDGKWNRNKQSSQKNVNTNHGDSPKTNFLKLSKTSGRRSIRDHSFEPESLDSYMDPILGTSMDSNSTTSGMVADQITMFHVVFVLRSGNRYNKGEAFAVYNDQARRLSRALQYCQKEHDYVTTESRKLIALRNKAKHTQDAGLGAWARIAEASELAWALQELFCQTVSGKIATFRLHGMQISLQLKTRHHHDLDSAKESKYLSPQSALLLLEPKDVVLAELSQTDVSPLATFVRELRPTKNLSKHATNLNIPIAEILHLSHHLIKWRKARLLRMPLHQRNTYVINPHAPMCDLDVHIRQYEKLFPHHLPSLPSMLKILGGGKPIRYGLLPPSRDHRNVYMDILAFLVREGFVRQLLTQGWLKIPYDYEPHPHPSPHHVDHHQHHHHHEGALFGGSERPPRPFSAMSLLSPHLRTAAAEDDEIASVSSDKTALPPGATSISRPSTANINKSLKRLSTATQITVTQLSAHHGEDSHHHPLHHHHQHDTIAASPAAAFILSPTDPSSKEMVLMSKVKQSFANTDARDLFKAVLPYLDGEHSFEEIAARIGFKRARVEESTLR